MQDTRTRGIAVAVAAALAAVAGAAEEPSGRNNEDFKGCLEVGDPVCGANGFWGFSMPLVRLGGPMDLDLTLNYRNDLPQFRPEELPQRFRGSPFVSSVYSRPQTGTETVGFQFQDGRVCAFKKVSGQWVLMGASDDPGWPDGGSSRRYCCVARPTTGPEPVRCTFRVTG